MSSLLRTVVALSLLAAALGACKRGSSDDDGPPASVYTPPPPPPPPAPLVVDLDVDTNRDGTVQDPQDETGEDTWTPSAGAVFYFNIDDDDSNNVVDHADAGTTAGDLPDLARVLIRSMPSLPATSTATILVSSAAQNRVRIFRNSPSWTQVYASGASFSIAATLISAGTVELGIEAREQVSPLWDGRVTLTLEVRDSAGTLTGSDAVLLRSAPWLMSTNLWPVEDLCVVTTAAPYGNSALRSVLSSTCSAAGVTYVEISGSSYSQDRWVQDSHETGALYLPATPRRRVDHVLQCARWREVDAWCESALWGPDFDFLARFSANASSMNYGGNLEASGPLASYPWGRIIVGGGTSAPIGGGNAITRRMIQVYRDYFNALDIQGPYLEISTEWLVVGHVDEIMQVVPAPANARGWAILLASPDLAVANLQTVAGNGGGSLTVFAGRSGWQTTVSAILNDSALMAYNDEVQTRIDGVRTLLQSQLGLAASEIINVPVLFEDSGFGGAVAYNPGVVNLVVIPATSGTTYLVIPDPEGPDQSTDVWQASTTAAIQPLFTVSNPVVISYADVWNAYHINLGEAHCGVNFVRTPPASDWWDD